MTARWVMPHGGSLFVRVHKAAAPVGVVVLLHGYSEHSGRYAHVIDAFVATGFTVVAPDHRGHGRTGPTLGWIAPPARVLADLDAVCQRAATLAPRRPLSLVGASMGALFALAALSRWPDRFAAGVLQAPAVEMPRSVSPLVVGAASLLGRVAPRVPVRPFFRPDRATRDASFQAWMRRDPYTYRGWVRAGTVTRSQALIRTVWRDLGRVRAPVLITHGADDARVHPDVSQRLAARLGASVSLRVFEGLRHEAHQEPEKAAVVQAWLDWITQHGAEGACS